MKKDIVNKSKFAILLLTLSILIPSFVPFSGIHAFGQKGSVVNQTTLQRGNNNTSNSFLRTESQELNNMFKEVAKSVVYIQVLEALQKRISSRQIQQSIGEILADR